MPWHPLRKLRAAPLWQPLKIRDFRLFWTGLAVSMLGDGMYFVALAWAAYEINNSPTSLSLVGFAWMVPQVFLFLFAGVLADRYDPRRIMIFADLVRLVAVAGLAVLALSGELQIWHLMILGAVYGVGEALFGPAFGTYVPQLVPPHLFVQANSLDSFLRPLAFRMIGPAIGGVMIHQAGIGAAFTLDAATFFISLLALSMIRFRVTPKATGSITVKTAVREVVEGLTFVRSQRWLLATLLAGTVALFAYWGPIEVLIPFLVKNEIGGGEIGYALVIVAGGLGSMVVSFTLASRGVPRRFMLFMYLVWGFAFASVSLVAFATSIPQAMVVLGISEGGFAAGEIVWATSIQRYVPPDLRGRVTSLDWFVSVALVPMSFILVGPVSAWIGAETTVVVGGGLAAVVAIGALLIPGVREVERREPLDLEIAKESQFPVPLP